MNSEERREYLRAWRKEHKEEIKSYYQAHKEERKAYYQAHKEERKAYQKSYQKSYQMAAYQKSYREVETNALKNNIRGRSNYYLFTILKHTKLSGYEIHHCFGYENHKQFIYIPKELHLQIHQFLRDNGISADSNHFRKLYT